MQPACPGPGRLPRFFVDRSLGAIVVPGLLRDAGFDVETMRDRYGERRAQVVADVDWLRDVGEAGLAVLMKDKRIRTRPAEQRAVDAYAVRCFCIARGGLTGPEMAALFVTHQAGIEALATQPGRMSTASRPGACDVCSEYQSAFQ